MLIVGWAGTPTLPPIIYYVTYEIVTVGIPERVMRVTFSLSQDDTNRIESIRSAFARQGHILNRSEVVRLALNFLKRTSPTRHKALLSELERLRPGRPSRKASK
jgi:hypothetical protein